MLDADVIELLNTQVNEEFFSSYLYLDIANYFADKGLNGFSNWYEIQAQEELDHALLFYHYLQNNNQKVILEQINKPEAKIKEPLEALKLALSHEEYITGLVNTIYAKANAVKDFRTMQFLDWFVKEQGEEETTATNLVTKFELFGNDPKGLYLLDSELSGRTYAPPSLVL